VYEIRTIKCLSLVVMATKRGIATSTKGGPSARLDRPARRLPRRRLARPQHLHPARGPPVVNWVVDDWARSTPIFPFFVSGIRPRTPSPPADDPARFTTRAGTVEVLGIDDSLQPENPPIFEDLVRSAHQDSRLRHRAQPVVRRTYLNSSPQATT